MRHVAVFVLLVCAMPAAARSQNSRELRTIAATGSDSALAAGVRNSPMSARAAWRGLLAAGAGKRDSAATAAFAAAARIAAAVALAWQDSFLVREGKRFESLAPEAQVATFAADSVWDAGVALIFEKGGFAAMETLRESERRFAALADSFGLVAAWMGVGLAFRNAQEYDSAASHYTRAHALAERIGDRRMWANSLGELGNVRWRQGDLRGARDFFARAREIFERMGDTYNIGMMHNSFGNVAWSGGDLAAAKRSFETGLELSWQHHDTSAASLFLSNLGALAAERGDYAESTQLLQQATAIYRARAESLEVAATLTNIGQVELRRGDYPAAARTFAEAAATFRAIGPAATIYEVDEITARTELAGARARMGDLQGARAELRRAEALTSRLSGSKSRASLTTLALAQADLALKFNQLTEAERQYTRAYRLARGDVAAQTRGRAQVGLAGVLYKREEFEGAQRVLEELLQAGATDSHNAVMTRLALGRAAGRRGDTTTARRAFREALDTLRAMGAVVDEAEALGGLAEVEARAGYAARAESLYQRGLDRLKARRFPTAAWPLHAGLAASLRHRGALDESARELRAGIDQIERITRTLQVEEHRSGFQSDKWDVYIDLALVERARGNTQAAFEASERLRARQMLDLLARGRVGDRGATAGLGAREQDLRRKMGELNRQLDSATNAVQELRGGEAEAPSEATTQKRQELAETQQQYQELLVEVRESDVAYGALVRGETVTARDVMQSVAPNEALLEYLLGDSTTLVFAVTRDSIVAFDVGLTRRELAGLVDFARDRLATTSAAGATTAWRAPLRRLFRSLLGPVEASGLLAGKARLIIAPHAELHYLPFGSLIRAGAPERFLIERYVLEYVPSASVWLRLKERPSPTPAHGILALAPRAATLPGSREEVAAIQRTYGARARGLVGPAATERAFRTLAPQSGVVHLATHGVLNKHNPLFSFVQLGAGGGEDGRLEVHEVFGLNLQARLLVLSACQTGVAAGAQADVPPGDDWVGLVNAFLYAGAENVLGTLWPVQDASTARLMGRFYRALADGRSEADALAIAQRAALRNATTAHPFFWAGFTLVRGN